MIISLHNLKLFVFCGKKLSRKGAKPAKINYQVILGVLASWRESFSVLYEPEAGLAGLGPYRIFSDNML
jgi:hypothetical protein